MEFILLLAAIFLFGMFCVFWFDRKEEKPEGTRDPYLLAKDKNPCCPRCGWWEYRSGRHCPKCGTDLGSGVQREPLFEEYSWDRLYDEDCRKGYSPAHGEEGKNPPSGGSNVQPPSLFAGVNWVGEYPPQPGKFVDIRED